MALFKTIVLYVVLITATAVPSFAVTVIYVKPDGSDWCSGLSWSQARKTIQLGIIAAQPSYGQVWVARGVYRDVMPVTLSPGVPVYGGFAGNETSFSQRDPLRNLTVIDAGLNDKAVIARNGCRIDGFKIVKGRYGVYCEAGYSPHIINCLIAGSEEGIYCSSGWTDIINNRIVGCRYGIHFEYGAPRVLHNLVTGCYYGICGTNNSASIFNNIVISNDYGIYQSAGSPELGCNDVYANKIDYSGIGPGQGDISTDPKLVSLEYGDFHIQPDSPCVNAGTYDPQDGVGEDMEGQSRVIDGRADIGPDECDGVSRTLTPRVLYVNASNPSGGDGTSWDNAYKTIQGAVDEVSYNGPAEIWTAAGLYPDSVTLVPFAHVFAGFAGVEISREQRDPKSNISTISGAYAGVRGASVSTLDGFTLRNCDFYCYDASPVIRNNVFAGACSIRCSRGSPLIEDNHINGEEYAIDSCWGSPSVRRNHITGAKYGIHTYYGALEVEGNAIIACANGIYSASTTSRIVNNTIIGGYCAVSVGNSSGTGIVANNLIGFNGVGIDRVGGTWILSKNDVYGNTKDYVNLDRGSDDISADPHLACLESGDFHLQPDSPCWNAGDPSYVRLDKDLDSQPRVQDGAVDIGADESNGTAFSEQLRVIYVSASAQPGGDGTGWQTAYNTITAAISDVAQNDPAQIWVASGFYPETVRLVPFAHLYGGFEGTETSIDQRNWSENTCSLFGNSPGIYGANLSRFDGFTVGGIECQSASPVAANNIVTADSQAGIWCGRESAPYIANCTILGGQYGVYSDTSTLPTIKNCIIIESGIGIFQELGGQHKPVTSHNNLFANERNYAGLLAGEGDISVDPKLDWFTSGVGLKPGSPCIDAGTDPTAPLFANRSLIRPQDGDADGTAKYDIGAYEAPLPPALIRKNLADGTTVSFTGVSVTAVFPSGGRTYVETTDRSSGIRVDKAVAFPIGSRVSVQGVAATDLLTGERYIEAADGWPKQMSGSFLPAPLGFSAISLGGSAMGLQEAVWGTRTGSDTLQPTPGPSNIGLLVKVWGCVTQIDPEGRYFYIDDGSGLRDGTTANGEYNVGTRVSFDGRNLARGNYIQLTGISSCFKTADGLPKRLLLVRTGSDILSP